MRNSYIYKTGWCVLCILTATLGARADVNFWTKTTSGNWEEQSWSLGVLPDSSQSVMFVNSGFKALTINPATAQNFPGSLTVNELTVACFTSGSNTLLLNFFGTAVPLRVLNGMAVRPGGRVLNLHSGLSVENRSLGITNAHFIQDGGFVRTTNVTVYLDGGGVYELTNGWFEAGAVQLAVQGDGNFNQYGGVASMKFLSLGHTAPGITGHGTYNLYDGNLFVRDTLHLGGFAGRGEFFQFGGTNMASLLELSPYWGGEPAYHLNGGVLKTDCSSIVASDFVQSTFEQNGGSHIVSNTLALYGSTIRGGPGHEAKYLLSNGILSARIVRLNGNSGYCIFSQTNGTTSISETFHLNEPSSAYMGNVFLHGGTLACGNVISAGAGDDILQSGGDFVVTNLFAFGGRGTFGLVRFARYTFNGGTLTASNIELSAEWVIASSTQTGRIANPGYFKLSGTLEIGDATEQLGRFILARNATIKMSGLAGKLSFADSRAENWTGMLIVSNWNGLPGGGGAEQLKFGTNQFGLTAEQLSRIRFRAGYPPDLYHAKILNTGEVVPGEVVRPPILFARQDNNLVLHWPPGWILQAATNLAGPYQDVPGATSPYTDDMATSAQRFFRLRQF